MYVVAGALATLLGHGGTRGWKTALAEQWGQAGARQGSSGSCDMGETGTCFYFAVEAFVILAFLGNGVLANQP